MNMLEGDKTVSTDHKVSSGHLSQAGVRSGKVGVAYGGPHGAWRAGKLRGHGSVLHIPQEMPTKALMT